MQRGFTLAEVLVSIVVYGLIMIAVFDFLRVAYIGSVQNPMALNAVDRVRTVTTLFTNEIRSASQGNDGSFPVAQASTTQIVFYSPYGSPSSTTVNRVRYYLSGGTLYKGVTVPTGNPLTYNLANEIVTTVLPNASTPTTSVFFYYNGSYGGTSTSPLVQPVNVTQVSYVQINIATRMSEVRNATTTFSVTTGAAIRNLKTNLGN